MAERDFLSLLVDETFKLQSSGEAELSSLELKLRDYRLNFLKGEFIPQFQVLRFLAPFGILDIPINWSIFNTEAYITEAVISEQNDSDHLLEIFKSSWSHEISQIFVTHSDGFCYIVGLRQGEEHHLHDLQSPQEWLKAA